MPLGECRAARGPERGIIALGHATTGHSEALMRRSLLVAAALSSFLVPRSFAQHSGAGPAAAPVAPREATQFDFLVGQWELTVRVPATGLAQRIHGAPRLAGTWKAWRAFDGWGIEDELRITDAAGNTRTLSHAMRVYDPAARRWSTTALDVFRARFTTATAQVAEGVLEMRSSGTEPGGRGYQSRGRFTDVTATAFRFRQERSYDEGRSWTESLTIEARRVAETAPR
jgi:hypothetical protein